ncbi:MAG: UDP-N-acetylglucosamine 2-epimerase, partial [Deltaproteobacteria bacterium]|nr:UDP-N-acetylglucosamine 2-epimerase [Deltaproteobacteria bacterium]
MYDSIFFNKSLAEKKSNVLDRLDLHDQSEEVCKYCLATIHRAENTDLSQNLEGILKALNQIAKTGMSVVLPLHPRTRAKIKEFELGAKLKFSTNATQSPSNPTNKDRLCER